MVDKYSHYEDTLLLNLRNHKREKERRVSLFERREREEIVTCNYYPRKKDCLMLMNSKHVFFC